MNQSDRHPQSLIDALIADIIAEIPLEDKVRFANLAEDEVQILEAVLGKFLNYRLEKLDEKVNEEFME
jgi:phage terminase Nu1 subunit (DNA packaging protein)